MLALHNVGNFLFFDVVKDDVAVFGAADDDFVVGRNAQLGVVGAQLEQVMFECLQQLHLAEVPNFDRVVFGGAHDVLFVGCHSHARHRVSVRVINFEAQFFRFGVPHFDGAVLVP